MKRSRAQRRRVRKLACLPRTSKTTCLEITWTPAYMLTFWAGRCRTYPEYVEDECVARSTRRGLHSSAGRTMTTRTADDDAASSTTIRLARWPGDACCSPSPASRSWLARHATRSIAFTEHALAARHEAEVRALARHRGLRDHVRRSHCLIDPTSRARRSRACIAPLAPDALAIQLRPARRRDRRRTRTSITCSTLPLIARPPARRSSARDRRRRSAARAGVGIASRRRAPAGTTPSCAKSTFRLRFIEHSASRSNRVLPGDIAD